MALRLAIIVIAFLLPVTVAGMMVGGATPFNATTADIPVIWALRDINGHFKQSNSDAAPRALVNIISATTQVVAGVNFHYRFYLKGGPKDEICEDSVWYRMWMEAPADLQGGDVSCEEQSTNSPSSPIPPSYTVSAQMNDGDVHWSLVKLVDRINDRSNSLYRQLPNGGTVTKEVTADGLFYHFSGLHMVQTICMNNNSKDRGKINLYECPIHEHQVSLPDCSGDVFWDPSVTSGSRYTVTLA